VREIKYKEQVPINIETCTILASEVTTDELNNNDIYVEDDNDKSFEEALQRANLLFKAIEGEANVSRLGESEEIE